MSTSTTNGPRLPNVTIVIPARDEAPSIVEIIKRSFEVCENVVVVDGHSTDGTRRVSEEAGAEVIMEKGRGKGRAIRTAIDFVETEVIVFVDADGSHDPEDVPRLVAPILAGEADHVGASRLIGGSSELHGGFDEFFRLCGSSFITACINKRFRARISDSQNGFRAARTEVLRALDLREATTTIEQEMVMKTLAYGYRLSEVPSHENPRRHGKSHIVVWKVAPRYGWSLLRGLARRRQPARDPAALKEKAESRTKAAVAAVRPARQ